MMRSTDINEASSRSHLLFLLRFEQVTQQGEVLRSKITFVDLAGSERVAKIKIDELLYEEALFINESL